MASYYFFLATAFIISTYYITTIETCGSVAQTSAPVGNGTNSTGGRKRRSIESEVELETTLDFTNNVSKKQSEGTQIISKIEQVLAADYYDIIMNSQTKTKSFKGKNGKIILKYTMAEVDCEQVTGFAEAAKRAFNYIKSAKVQCDGDILEM